MKRRTTLIVAGICLGSIVYYGWRRYRESTRLRTFHLTTDDLHYSNYSPEELVSQHLVDLNSADDEQISKLGLVPQSLERLLENRPYRNKLELVSRMVLSDEEYSVIKDKVSVSEGAEPVKIG